MKKTAMKRKVIEQVSNQIIEEMQIKDLSIEEIKAKLQELQKNPPKNHTERRILQRVSCVVGGYIQIKEGKFVNKKLYGLILALNKVQYGKTEQK